MSISSIDDIVEQGIRNVISAMGHLARHIQSRGSVIASHLRSILGVIALVTVGFLFRPQLILAIAITSFVLGVVPLWIERRIREAKGGHAAQAGMSIAQAELDECGDSHEHI